jgi:hypothetical protein
MGLERAITLSESMESRGFGSPALPRVTAATWQRAGIAVALASTATAGYLLAVGKPSQGALALVGGLALFATCLRGGESRRTVFRVAPLKLRDWTVIAASCASMLVILIVLSIDPGALRYEPYPSIEIPRIDLFLLLAIAALLVPALATPSVRSVGHE